jgi:hypothetical protein
VLNNLFCVPFFTMPNSNYKEFIYPFKGQ